MVVPRRAVFPVVLGCFCVVLMFATVVQAGTLRFYANGEELASEGFVAPQMTKDGWTLRFSHIFVTLSDITAYQTDPPYDPHGGAPIAPQARVALPGTHTIDLVADAGDDARVLVGEVAAAAAGHYNAISWRMTHAGEGPAAGFSVVLIGTAEKDGSVSEFRLYSDERSSYRCGEFVGDERKGFLQRQGSADLEMTFHLDHIFGRSDKPADDTMNSAAPGFAPFAEGAPKQRIALRGLHVGHAGEGHCSVEWD